jgi:hypothetical protein
MSNFAQDSLMIEFEKFESMLQKLEIDTTNRKPTKFENFELIWVRNVAHSHAEVERGSMNLYDENSLSNYQLIASYDIWHEAKSPGQFIGDDYFVVTYSYNQNMSTIFNDTYYFKRKTINSFNDLFLNGGCQYGEHTGPGKINFDTTLFNYKVSDLERLDFKNFESELSGVPQDSKVDTNAYYKLKYYHEFSNGFDLYSGNKNYECLYKGNEAVIHYSQLIKFINQANRNGMFKSWRNINDSFIYFSSHISMHGGTFDIEAQTKYYFEKVE